MKKVKNIMCLYVAVILGTVAGLIVENFHEMSFWKYLVLFALVAFSVWQNEEFVKDYGGSRKASLKLHVLNAECIMPLCFGVFSLMFGIGCTSVKSFLGLMASTHIYLLTRNEWASWVKWVYLTMVALIAFVLAVSFDLGVSVLSPIGAAGCIFAVIALIAYKKAK